MGGLAVIFVNLDFKIIFGCLFFYKLGYNVGVTVSAHKPKKVSRPRNHIKFKSKACNHILIQPQAPGDAVPSIPLNFSFAIILPPGDRL